MTKNEIDYYDLRLDMVPDEVLKIIGIELKRRRIKNDSTLKSVSCGCSISYISKVERGKIVPSYRILREMCSEQGIKTNELNMLLSINENIIQCIEAYARGDLDFIKDIYYKALLFENYKGTIIRLFYDALSGETNNLIHDYQNLLPIYKDLSSIDKTIMAFFKMVIDNKTNDFLSACNSYPSIKLSDNNTLNALIYRELFYALIHCDLKTALISFELVEKSKYLYLLEDYNNLRRENLLCKIKCGYLIEDNIIMMQDSKTKLLYAVLNKRKDMLENMIDNPEYTMSDLFFIYNAMDNFERAYTIYKQIDMASVDFTSRMMMKYIVTKEKWDPTMVQKYIMEELVPYAIEKQNIDLLERLITELATLSQETTRYRDVSYTLNEYYKIIERHKNVSFSIIK